MSDIAAQATPKPARPKVPIAELLGAKSRGWDAENGIMRMEYEAKPIFENGAGAIQGGIITAMLDNAMSIALLRQTNFAYGIPTLELKTSYLRAARSGDALFGEGWVAHQGKSIAFLEGRLRDAEGRVVATASATVKLTPLKQDG